MTGTKKNVQISEKNGIFPPCRVHKIFRTLPVVNERHYLYT